MSVTKGKFVPVMLTPFREDGSVDYDVLAKLTNWYLENGATGLFANCLSSEMFELTEKERLDITSFVVQQAAGAVPVFSTGTFGGLLQEQADFCKRIYDTGATAVVAISSVLAEEREADEVLTQRSLELFSLTDGIPFGFYECPVPYKRVLPAAQLKQLAETGRVTYYKDTSLDIGSIREKCSATGAFPSFELYDAYMVNAVASLRAGCAGLSCIQGNFVPELISWIGKHVNDPACADRIERAQQFLADTMDVMHHIYPVAAKLFLAWRGLPIGTTTRRPVGGLQQSDISQLHMLSEKYDRILEELEVRVSV